MANRVDIAATFLDEFVARGAGCWQETVVETEQQALLKQLPRVRTEFDALDADVRVDPDAVPDAIEAAVHASATALADPHRSAALRHLGFTAGSRGKSKTDREDLAAQQLRRKGRWFRTPSPSLDGAEPRERLLSLVAEQLASENSEKALPHEIAGDDASGTASPASNGSALSPEGAQVWPTFPYDRVADAIAEAREEVRILQSWVPDAQPFAACLGEALRRGASVQVLILRPDCDAARRRMATLGIDDPDYVRYHAAKLLGDLRLVAKLGPAGTVTVKTYEADPLVQLYGTEERLWLGLFWPGQFSMQSPQVEVAATRTTLGRALSTYFADLWTSSTAIESAHLKR